MLLVDAAAAGIVRSAHDCAEGGLAVTLAECSFDTGLGAEINIPAVPSSAPALRDVATMFGESASRVLVSAAPERAHEILGRAAAAGVPAAVIGRVGGNHIRISVDGRVVLDEALALAEQVWSTAIDRYFESRKASA